VQFFSSPGHSEHGDLYAWTTVGPPTFFAINHADFCRVLNGRSILLVGDSIDCQLFEMMQQLHGGEHIVYCYAGRSTQTTICNDLGSSRLFAIKAPHINTEPLGFDHKGEHPPLGLLFDNMTLYNDGMPPSIVIY